MYQKHPTLSAIRQSDEIRLAEAPEGAGDLLCEGDYWLAVGGQLRIARKTGEGEDGSITADLYRNLADYRAGRVMERDFLYW